MADSVPAAAAVPGAGRGRAWVVWSAGLLVYVVAVAHRSSFGVAGLAAQSRFGVAATVLSLFVVIQLSVYAAAQVRAISEAPTLRVTGADDGGWTFRVSRTYASDEQAQAFQYVLDRLQVLNVIAWSRSARSISVTASPGAKVLEPLLDRLGERAK